tara:strand:- start:666 stop:1556 length:891 start_codon:yes stop_codon:yes gene_type:complete
MTAQETNLVNAFETTLNGAVASGDSSIALTDNPGVAAKVYLVIDPDNDSKREIVLWNSGAFGAAAVTRDVDAKHDPDPAHADGTKVRLAVVKQHIEDVHDRIDDVALTGDVTGTLADATQDIATTIAAGAVDFAMINQGDLITQAESITSNDSDTKIPTAAAVKNYADAEAATLTNKVLKDYNETTATITSAVDMAIDLANGNTGTVTLGHNVDDLHFTNVPTSGVTTFTLVVTQDGTGSRTMDIDAVSVNGGGDVTAKTVGGAGLTLSTAAASIDILTFVFVGTTPFLFSQLAFA